MKVLLFVVASIMTIQAFKPEYITDVVKEGNVYSQMFIGRSILDSVQQVIYDLLQNAENLLNTLRTALSNVLDSAIGLLIGLLKDTENLLLTIAGDVLQQIQQVDEIHLQCVANQEKNVEQILAAARKDIHSLIVSASVTIDGIQNRSSSFELDIGNEISKIKQLLSQCFSINPVEIMECVIGQVNEIGDSLLEIKFYASQTIKRAAAEVDQIVRDTRSSVDIVINGVRNQLDAISKDIVNCIGLQKPN